MGRRMARESILKQIEKNGGVKMPLEAAAEDKLLARQTHLHMNGHNIAHIDCTKLLVKLEVLYLYDNRIEALENLTDLKHLTHLYLQNNQLHSLRVRVWVVCVCVGGGHVCLCGGGGSMWVGGGGISACMDGLVGQL